MPDLGVGAGQAARGTWPAPADHTVPQVIALRPKFGSPTGSEPGSFASRSRTDPPSRTYFPGPALCCGSSSGGQGDREGNPSCQELCGFVAFSSWLPG